MQDEQATPRALGNGVIYAMSGEQKYYTFTSDDGSFSMMLPVGTYSVYGQYMKNDGIYESKILTNVNVIGLDMESGATPLTITILKSLPRGMPMIGELPGTYTNTVNGTVMFLDGSGIPGVTVSLWQSDDACQSNYLKVAETMTDSSGYYQFNDVRVTSDPPDCTVIYGMKVFRVYVSYPDPLGKVHVQNKTFPIYNPNVILGIGGTEQNARNVTADLQIDYTQDGWINIQSDPAGAKVFVDNKALIGPDGKQLTTPCTAYIPAGSHMIKLASNGYADKEYPVIMAENQQTMDLVTRLEKPIVPAITISGGTFVLLASAILLIIVGIAIGLVIALLVIKRN